VSLMQGSIKISSNLGQGTKFTITLPVNAEFKDIMKGPCQTMNRSNVELSSQDSRSIQGRLANNSLRALIFEKDEILRNLLIKMMTQQNMEYSITSSFKRVLDFIDKMEFQMIILDMDMNICYEDFLHMEQQIKMSLSNGIIRKKPQIFCLH